MGISHSFPASAERGVQLVAQWFQGLLELLPDDVNLGIVGDGLEGDVGNPLVDEPLAYSAVGGGAMLGAVPVALGLLPLPLRAVREQVEGIAGIP